MERCPACNARYKGKEKCHRCGMEIASLIAIKERAQTHLKQAVKLFYQEEFDQMYFHAGRANALYQTSESMKIFACAALMVNNYEQAIKLRRQHLNCQQFCSS